MDIMSKIGVLMVVGGVLITVCRNLFAEADTEPTISKMEHVDKDINVRSKDEPQTCSVNGRPYNECSSCEHFKCTADEPQTDCPWK